MKGGVRSIMVSFFIEVRNTFNSPSLLCAPKNKNQELKQKEIGMARRVPTDRILCVTPLQVWRPRNITRRREEVMDDNSIDGFGNENIGTPLLAGDKNWDTDLKGYNVHSIHSYSDLTYQEVALAVKAGNLTREQALAVLMNADLYIQHQEYYKNQDPFLIDNEYFQKSRKWKKVNIVLEKHKFDDKFRMFEYKDQKDLLRRFTLIMCNAEEENKYHLVQTRPNGERNKTIEVSEDETEEVSTRHRDATSEDQAGEEVPKDQAGATSENQSVQANRDEGDPKNQTGTVLNQTDVVPLELQAKRDLKRKGSDDSLAREDTVVKKKKK